MFRSDYCEHYFHLKFFTIFYWDSEPANFEIAICLVYTAHPPESVNPIGRSNQNCSRVKILRRNIFKRFKMKFDINIKSIQSTPLTWKTYTNSKLIYEIVDDIKLFPIPGAARSTRLQLSVFMSGVRMKPFQNFSRTAPSSSRYMQICWTWSCLPGVKEMQISLSACIERSWRVTRFRRSCIIGLTSRLAIK